VHVRSGKVRLFSDSCRKTSTTSEEDQTVIFIIIYNCDHLF
jgi:hypothetical protein